MDKVNLATLCLNLYEGMEDCFAGCSYSVKPMPKDEAFNREIVIGEYIYCALQTIVREMIRVFGKQNNEITISTYRAGIVILGLEISNKELTDLCLSDGSKFIIQQSRLGLALAFLKLEQVKVEQFFGAHGDGIAFGLSS